MPDSEVVIVEGARTAVGSFGGAFRDTPAHQLGAAAIRGALARADVATDDVDEVVLGCVGQVGEEAFNARLAAIAAGLSPERSTAHNVNRLCSSGVEAIWSATKSLRLGEASVVVAGGNENMTRQPFLDSHARDGYRLGDRPVVDGALSLVTDPWGHYPMGVTAEEVAAAHGVGRAEQDEFAHRSQQRAAKAAADGVFDEEIVPVTVTRSRRTEEVTLDEHPRPDTTRETLGRLRTVFRDDGTVTAGNSSGINDGAAALVLMRAEDAGDRAVLGRVVDYAVAGTEPRVMGYAPVFALQRLFARAPVDQADVGVVELNEAFAAQAVAVLRDAGLDPEVVNPHGGAIALGHPVGATGAILALRALYHMRRTGTEWGVVTMCVGGGQGVALLLRAG